MTCQVTCGIGGGGAIIKRAKNEREGELGQSVFIFLFGLKGRETKKMQPTANEATAVVAVAGDLTLRCFL